MDKKVIEYLNKLLHKEFLAIRAYALNGYNLLNKGYTKIANKFLEEANLSLSKKDRGEAEHEELLSKRILMLGGKFDVSSNDACEIHDNMTDLFKYTLALEQSGIEMLREAIFYCSELSVKDFYTADMLTDILRDEEAHKLWIEQQLNLIQNMGMQNYIQFVSKEEE